MGRNPFWLVTSFAKTNKYIYRQIADAIYNYQYTIHVNANHAPSSAPDLICVKLMDKGSWGASEKKGMRSGAPNSSCPYRYEQFTKMHLTEID